MALSNRMKDQKKQSGQNPQKNHDPFGTAQLGNTSVLQGEEDVRLDEIVARLKKSKHEFLEDEYALGRIEGTEWAENDAEEIQLQRLAKHAARVSARCMWEEKLIYSTAEYCAFIIDPSEMGDQTVAADFWALITGRPKLPSTNYVRGFTAGAMEVWEKVKDLV